MVNNTSSVDGWPGHWPVIAGWPLRREGQANVIIIAGKILGWLSSIWLRLVNTAGHCRGNIGHCHMIAARLAGWLLVNTLPGRREFDTLSLLLRSHHCALGVGSVKMALAQR